MGIIATYDGKIFHNPSNKFCIVIVKTADTSVPEQARDKRRYKDHLIRFTAVGYKSIGRAGTVVTEDAKMYLMQRCEDGFILREFNGYRRYRKGDYKNPEVSSWEIRRAIYDHNANPINAYYWGLYKQAETRWIRTSFCVPN